MSQQSPIPSDSVPPPGWQKIEFFKAHKKIHPRHITGIFQSWRWIMVWVTQLVYYGVPWLQWEGRQAILFDIEARRFYLMGWVLYPQDFIYLTGLLVACALSLFLFTAAAGRLWCGYACPQTVYSEIFMWVERKCEGDRSARLRLENSRWLGERLWRSGSKHLIWIAIALWTSFTFVGYFTPIRELGADVLAWNLGPWQMFWLGFYALATWGNAGFMREQVCLYMCPYARFQSAMLDKDSLIITYDVKRGEPRGPIRKSAAAESPAQGDCIDCGLCVQVCPTGIDIRNGLQYACIGCAACIDACDSVMDRVGRARGLVRYDTERGLPGESPWAALLSRLWRPRILIYTALLTVVAGLVITGLSTRMPLRVDVIRDRTVLARIVDDGRIENVYRLQLMNAREQTMQVRIRAGGIPGLTILGASDTQPAEQLEVSIEPLSVRSLPVRVQLEPGQLPAGQHPMRFEIRSTVDGHTLEILEGSIFMQP
jgi:cytochrome c oxidase accessory protein FixG